MSTEKSISKPGPRLDEDGDGAAVLRRYVAVLRKRALIITAAVAAGCALAVLYTSRQPKVYSATASVIIDPQPPQVFGSRSQEVIQLGSGGYWGNQDYYNTQVDILGSYELAELTVRRLSLHDDRAFSEPPQTTSSSEEGRIERAARKLHSSIRATQNRESRIVKIHVSNTNPELAIRIANGHVDSYLAYTLGLRTKGTGHVSKFLATELDAAASTLQEAENKLYNFKKDNGILSVSLEDKQSMLAADIARYSTAHSEARIQRLRLETLRSQAKRLGTQDATESPIFSMSKSNRATVENLELQLATENQRLIEMSEELGPRNPEYIQQKNKVDETRAAIRGQAKRVVREIEQKYQATLASERKFAAEIERLKAEAFELGPKAKTYSEAKREFTHAEEAYNFVLGRLRTSNLTGRNKEINVRPHTAARNATLVSPRMGKNVVLAFLLSLFLGVVIAFGIEYLDQTITSSEAVERATGAPVLGIIPIVSTASGSTARTIDPERDLYVFHNPKSRAAECCRAIRTNIMFSAADRERKKLVVTSPRPQEGKTTSAIYLGITMAQGGQRVLLIDTDLRRPRLHKSLGVSRSIGLTTLLLNETSLDDAVKTTEIPNLFILPAGPQPPNPTELLLTKHFHSVIAQLSESYDRIIFDSPPILAVTDAAVLAGQADGVILVTRAGSTTTDDATNAARQIYDVGGDVLGVILNDMSLDDGKYSAYYYAYGYGEGVSDAEHAT